MSKTRWPISLKYSATPREVFAASRLIMGLSSLVDTTTIALPMPVPSVSSTNSFTSRPRSPMAAKTVVSN